MMEMNPPPDSGFADNALVSLHYLWIHLDTSYRMTNPEQDAQSVGAYPEPCLDHCCDYHADSEKDVERCGEPATHTVVMRDQNGQLFEIAMCDKCGSPEDAKSI